MAFWKLKHGLEGRVTHGHLVPMFMIIGRLLLIVSSIIFQWLPAKSEVNIVMSLAESWRFGLGSILVIDPSLLCVMIWVVSINLTRFVLVPSLLMQSKIVSWQLKSPLLWRWTPISFWLHVGLPTNLYFPFWTIWEWERPLRLLVHSVCLVSVC